MQERDLKVFDILVFEDDKEAKASSINIRCGPRFTGNGRPIRVRWKRLASRHSFLTGSLKTLAEMGKGGLFHMAEICVLDDAM